MNLERITQYEESLLTDTCEIYKQEVGIKDGVPIKAGSGVVSEKCLVCSDSASVETSHGLFENIPVYYVKLPKERMVSLGDYIAWKGQRLVITRTNYNNTWRVLTVAECQRVNG